MNWHAGEQELTAYRDRGLSAARTLSVEEHLFVCSDCRARVASVADETRLGAIWEDVVDVVDRPRRSLFERALCAVGIGDGTSRLVATTPSLRGSWMAGVVILLVVCVLAGEALGSGAPVLFLAAAPLIPLLTVAATFGPRFDPVAELTQSTPTSSLRLMLLRTLAVLVATLPLTLLAEVTLDMPSVAAARWLLPSLAMTSVTLALSTRVNPAVTAGLVGGAWLSALIAVSLPAGTARAGQRVADLAVFEPVGQALCLTVVVVAGAGVFLQRDMVEIRRFV